MNIIFIVPLILIFLGIFGMIYKQNLLNKIISMNIASNGIILFFVLLGYKTEAVAPIIHQLYKKYVNPVPQALMLTAIVIGFATSCVALALILKIHKHFGSIDMKEIFQNDNNC